MLIIVAFLAPPDCCVSRDKTDAFLEGLRFSFHICTDHWGNVNFLQSSGENYRKSGEIAEEF